jgi:pyridoxamine 5'-phosphate oxidase-like protein
MERCRIASVEIVDPKSVTNILESGIAQEMMASNFVCRLAYIGRDGYPRVVPIGYLWRPGRFIVCTTPNAPKVKALGSNPRVALTIDTETMPPRILLVRGTARIEVVDGVPPEYLEASFRYVPREQWDAFETQVRGLYKQMARITITPGWAKLIDFETTLPSAVEELMAGRV